jgi:putative ABC transport system permease protein
VRVDRPDQLQTLVHQIDDAFRNSDYETRTLTESDALAAGLSALGDLRGIVLSLCAIVILTVLLIAANSAAMMVRERINEVAVMRAIGFGRPAIAAMLFGECGAIGLCGGILGAGAALWIFGSGVVVGALGGAGALWVRPEGAALALTIATATTLVSGILPIWSAIRIAPAMGITQIV